MRSCIFNLFLSTLLIGLSVTEELDNEEFNNSEYTDGNIRIRHGDMIFQIDADPTRKVVDETCRKWADGLVPYVNVDMPASQFTVMLRAMKTWEKHTCVKFQNIAGNAELLNEQHVRIRSVTNGCYSHVGRICSTRVKNEIGMARGCTNSNGTPVHELGHTLGLYHEQSRPDRDSFVTIVEDNIITTTLSNFQIAQRSTTLSVPYDYYSVMHYPRRGFSKNGQNTIVTKNLAFQNIIGRRTGPSFADIQSVNIAYNCAKSCTSSLKCRLSSCFVNKNCKCVCSDKAPASGQYSPSANQEEEDPTGTSTNPAPPPPPSPPSPPPPPPPPPPPAPSPSPPAPTTPTSRCGGSFSLKSFFSYVFIRAPRRAGKYLNNQRCVWTITNDMNSETFPRLRFSLFSYDFASDQPSCGDYISVNKKGDSNFTGINKICGKESSSGSRPTVTVTSDSDRLSVIFESDQSGTGRGFTAIVRPTN